MSVLLEVKNLFVTTSESTQPLVKGVTFSLAGGQKLGLVGESGSGKSLICKAIAGLLPPGLRVLTDSLTLETKNEKVHLNTPNTFKDRAKYIGYVFQEPMSALNPTMMIGKQIMEALETSDLPASQKIQMTLDWLERVQLPDPAATFKKYPHQLSGGQRQRVVIAMAMIKKPVLLIADEPTTALDMIVQAEILDLIRSLCREVDTMLIFVSHDLDLVGSLCETIMVIRQGEVLETGNTKEIYRTPQHPYTQALLLSKPRIGYKPEYLPVVSDFLDEERKVPNMSESFAGLTSRDYRRGPIVHIHNISKSYRQNGKARTILKNITLVIDSGETVGIVGPSGCGKSTLARILCGVEKADAGSITFHRPGRRADAVQLVFQDPFSSLNPQLTIGRQVMEPLLAKGLSGTQAENEAREILNITGIDGCRFYDYPHRFSGGQRQRIAIARALVLRPALLVLDESVAALDVSVQAVVINLLNDLKRHLHLSYLFITHNLIIADYFCDRILVMYEGEFVEQWSGTIATPPKHPFTQKLIGLID
ncbi:MAG: ABC transporter ATP-binding protein [Thermaurantimonas sp.]